jgi:hypothetical protein
MNVLADVAVASQNESDVIVIDSASDKENVPQPVPAASEGLRRRGNGYTRIEDLIICKSFIAASEDAITGAYQKANVFKNKMHNFFLQFLVEQEQLDALRYSTALKFASPDNVLPVYDRRNPASIHARFKEVLSCRVSKFLAVESSTIMASGWDTERYYLAVKHNFEQKWPRLGNADEIRQCVDYLRDKPKWNAYLHANTTGIESANFKRPTGQKKEKSKNKDKALVKEVIKELNLPTMENISSDDETNRTQNAAKNDFFATASTAMIAYAKCLKDRSDEKFVMTLPSPEKKMMQKAKTDLMIEELKLQAEEIAAKRRRLNSVIEIQDENYSSDDGY